MDGEVMDGVVTARDPEVVPPVDDEVVVTDDAEGVATAVDPSPQRSRTVARRLWPYLLFVALTVLFMPRALAGMAVAAPTDMLVDSTPYRAHVDIEPPIVNGIQSDQVEGWPNVLAFYRDLREGRVQVYDERVIGGTPTGVMPVFGVWSPFNVGFLFLPEWYAVTFSAALALFTSMAFLYRFLRDARLGQGAAVLAAVAFTFNGTNLVLMQRVMAIFLVPVVLWACLRAYRRRSVGSIALVALATAALWQAGFPSGFIYGVIIEAAFVGALVVDALRNRRKGNDRVRNPIWGAVAAGLGVVWGTALIAFTFLPFSKEIAASGELARRVYGSDVHLRDIHFWDLWFAGAGGDPLVQPWLYHNPVESASVVGLIVGVGAFLTLVAAARGKVLVRSRTAAVLWVLSCVIAPVVTLLSFRGTVLLTLAYRVPGLGQGPMWRTRFLVSLALAIIAAIGFDQLVRRAISRRWGIDTEVPLDDDELEGPAPVSRVAAGLCLAAFAVLAVITVEPYLQLAEQVGQRAEILRRLLVAIALTVPAIGAALAVRRWPRLAMPATALIAVLLFLQLGWPLRKFTPEVPVSTFYPELAGHRELQRLTGEGERFRFASDFYKFQNYSPNTALLHKLSDVRGVAVGSADFRKLIVRANPNAFTRDPLKLILARSEWALASPVYDETAMGYFALGQDEVPYGLDGPPIDEWTERWRPARELATAPLPAPPGEVAGITLLLRLNGPECSTGDARVTLADGIGHRTSAERPVRDLVNQDWVRFGLVGRELDRSTPLTVDVEHVGPGQCAIDAGVADAEGPERPAMQWTLDDPDDGIRLVSTVDSWIYERPTAQPLLSAHGDWLLTPDDVKAMDEVTVRDPEAPYRAVVVDGGGAPASPGPGQAGRVEVRGSDVGEADAWIDVSAERDAVVAYRINESPDWHATVDGEPAKIHSLNGAQLAVFVPAGDHRVRFEYRPTAFKQGLLITLPALGLVLVAGLWTGFTAFRRRRGSASGSGTPGAVDVE